MLRLLRDGYFERGMNIENRHNVKLRFKKRDGGGGSHT